MLDDLKACSYGNGNKGRLVINGNAYRSLCRKEYGCSLFTSALPDAAKAILAVKMLGKMPVGSEVIATPANLSTLLALSTAFKNDPDATSEALRCVANALLLVDSARNTWVDKQVGGGEACISLLDVKIPVIMINVKLIRWWPHRNRPRLTKSLLCLASCSSALYHLPRELLFNLLWKTSMDHLGQRWTLLGRNSIYLPTVFWQAPRWVGRP